MQAQNENAQEKLFLRDLGRGIFARLTKEFEDYTGLSLRGERKLLIAQELTLMEQDFFAGLDRAYAIARDSFRNGRFSAARMRHFNPKMDAKLKQASEKWPQSADVWIIGGLMVQNQVAGLKTLYGLNQEEGTILDVLGSATSLSLGAQNPYLSIFDRVEDALGMRDNICSAYHPSARQAFFLEKIAALYPASEKIPLSIHSESSGAIVNSVSIECALAFIEKRGNGIDAKILAVDGTWAGGHGSAREATGFGVADFEQTRSGRPLYVDRCLPCPTKDKKQEFLSILRQKIKDGAAAGLYIEPDIIGDAGVAVVDPEVLKEALAILKQEALPVIADCVQQIGRTGPSYWGETTEAVLKDYPWLIITAAKSASNGQPFGFTIMPKEIADCAYPRSHLSTNQYNGPLLRAIGVSEFMTDSGFQAWLSAKSTKIEEMAEEYNIPLGHGGLRGKYMNRGVYVGSNDNVKLAQIALLVEDGILTGALPQSLRYQPMLMEYASTNSLVAQIIFRRVGEVMKGNISPEVETIYNSLQGEQSGLAR